MDFLILYIRFFAQKFSHKDKLTSSKPAGNFILFIYLLIYFKQITPKTLGYISSTSSVWVFD
jgi:hypothetical protein